MGFVNIAAELKEIIDTMKSAPGTKLAQTFDYDAPGPDTLGYPYACVAQQEAVEDPLDSANNKALYKFLIRVVDVATDKTQMEADMRSLADAILAELRRRANATFGGVADKVFPFRTTWKWDQAENMPSRICEIEVTIQQSHSIW